MRVLLTYERTVGYGKMVEDSDDHSQDSRTGINACSIRTNLYQT